MVEYKFILEIARHGARAPSDMFEYAKDPALNFPRGEMEMTELGA